MTVSELISELQKHDPDAVVMIGYTGAMAAQDLETITTGTRIFYKPAGCESFEQEKDVNRLMRLFKKSAYTTTPAIQLNIKGRP